MRLLPEYEVVADELESAVLDGERRRQGSRIGDDSEEKAMNGTTAKSDRDMILEHIDSIFQAYIRRDRDAIRRLHTDDWIGFQGPSTTIERGIDAHMKNADASLEHFRGTGYEILDRCR